MDGQPWNAPASEKPQVGTTEDWTIVNPTMNSHPIHLHLAQFQLVERQIIASAQYQYAAALIVVRHLRSGKGRK